MPRITNAQLSAQLEASHIAYERLAAEHAALKAECEALRRPALRTQTTGPGRNAYQLSCAAARELAMRTGRCVRVGG